MRWIPVAENLPKEYKSGKTISKDCILFTDDGEMLLGFYSIASGWYDFHGQKVDGVTHWMEAPDRPEGT